MSTLVLIGLVINVVLALIVYHSWGYIDKTVDMDTLYDQYSIQSIRVMMSTFFLLFGWILLICTMLYALCTVFVR